MSPFQHLPVFYRRPTLNSYFSRHKSYPRSSSNRRFRLTNPVNCYYYADLGRMFMQEGNADNMNSYE
jgi:hypothetical protein